MPAPSTRQSIFLNSYASLLRQRAPRVLESLMNRQVDVCRFEDLAEGGFVAICNATGARVEVPPGSSLHDDTYVRGLFAIASQV